MEAVLSSNTFCTCVGGFSTAKPNRRQPRTFGVVGGSYWGCGFVDDHLSYAKSGVCTSKTSSGVMMALNKYLYVQADRIVGREQKSRCRAFCSKPWIGSAVHRQLGERGDTGAMVEVSHRDKHCVLPYTCPSWWWTSIHSRGVLYFSKKFVRLVAAESVSD